MRLVRRLRVSTAIRTVRDEPHEYVMPHAAGPTDQELVERARDGDALAFEQIIHRYEGQVAATVIGMMGRCPEADDVGQETFIRLHTYLHKYRGDAALGTYIVRIAINQALKALKQRKRWRERFVRPDQEALELLEPVVKEGDAIDARERKRLVHAALGQINPEQRAVVVLRMLEGYSTRETAAMLNVPEGTVMSRLSRALERLKGLLGPLLLENP
ncbi:MAG: RNA polymerase sigma factor [Bacteroidetes bacterium SB0662_bin_6]|nr:RNA polymerase sigma factor [Bacteroidetes bacterium SB0668_bin_1]MYE05368.1 RNA polymerase sigma factor [Bacteroidetes bacterium SB0662_bin_6]